MREIIGQIKLGQVKMGFEHKGLEPMLEKHDQISNRIAFAGIEIASLTVYVTSRAWFGTDLSPCKCPFQPF